MIRVSTRTAPLVAAALVAACTSEVTVPSVAPAPAAPAPVAAVVAAPAVAPSPPVAVAPADTSDHVADELREQHRHHHHGGVTMFIAMALDTLAVSEASRPKVARLQQALADSMAPAQEVERAVVGLLAGLVEAGAVDAPRVEASVSVLERTAAGSQGRTLDALRELHATLSPLERATLVHKVQAHWIVWGRVNGVGGAGGAVDNARKALDARLAELSPVIGLTPDQSDAIGRAAAAMTAPDVKDVGAHIDAFSRAFVADAFDAKPLGLGSAADGRLASAGATQMVRFCAAAVPILNADQRSRLAAHLREHLDHSDTPSDSPEAESRAGVDGGLATSTNVRIP